MYVGSVSPGSRSNPYETLTPGIMPSHPLTQPYRTRLVPLTDYSQADAGGSRLHVVVRWGTLRRAESSRALNTYNPSPIISAAGDLLQTLRNKPATSLPW